MPNEERANPNGWVSVGGHYDGWWFGAVEAIGTNGAVSLGMEAEMNKQTGRMKGVSVYLDDHTGYKRPLVGRLTVFVDQVAETVAMLKQEAGDDFLIEVNEPDNMANILAKMRELSAHTDC